MHLDFSELGVLPRFLAQILQLAVIGEGNMEDRGLGVSASAGEGPGATSQAGSPSGGGGSHVGSGNENGAGGGATGIAGSAAQEGT